MKDTEELEIKQAQEGKVGGSCIRRTSEAGKTVGRAHGAMRAERCGNSGVQPELEGITLMMANRRLNCGDPHDPSGACHEIGLCALSVGPTHATLAFSAP